MHCFRVVCLLAVGALAYPPQPAAARQNTTPGQNSLTPITQFDGRSLAFDFPSVEVGVAEYAEGPTGATVLYFPSRAVVAVDVRGGSPGTSGTDVLRYGYDTPLVDAIVLAGGSSYGLEAVEGVRGGLLASGRRDATRFNIATVLGAIIYDFADRTSVYPDRELGSAALLSARAGQFPLGARGAGRSASVGKYFGYGFREPAGQGAAFMQLRDTKIAVFTIVNALGVIVDRAGRVVRGNSSHPGERTHVLEDLATGEAARKRALELQRTTAGPDADEGGNTTLTVVVTNQKLTYADLQRLAMQVHTSMARSIQPFQTRRDGDVLFAVTTSEIENASIEPLDLGTFAGELAWDAILSSLP